MTGVRFNPDKALGKFGGGASKPCSPARYAWTAAVVGVTFYLGGRLGHSLATPPESIATFWPPNTVLLVALLLTTPRRWWVYFLAVAPAYGTAAYQAGSSVHRVLFFAPANVMEILVAAIALRLAAGDRIDFRQLRGMVTFLVCAVLVAPAVSATIAAAESIGKPDVSYWLAWRVWYLGDAMGHLTLTPVILLWVTGGTEWVRRRATWRSCEAVALAIGLLAVSFHALGGEIGAAGNLPTLVYAPLPFLLWAAIRFGPRGICTAVFAVALISIWNAIHDRGPFTTQSPAENVLALQLFLVVVSVPLMLLGSLLAEREQAAARISQSEQRFRTIFNKAPLGIGLVDSRTGDMRQVNPRYAEIVGRSPEEMATIDWMSITHPEDVQEDLDNMAKLNAGAITGFQMNKRYIRPDGSIVWINLTVAPVGERDASHPHHLALVEDITDRKTAEAEREKLFSKLESQNAELERFAYTVSHDLKSPLITIKGYLGMLKEDLAQGAAEEIDDDFRRIAGATDTMARLLDDVLELSRIGRTASPSEDVCMTDLARNVVESIAAVIRERNIDIRIEPDMPTLRVDRVRMHEVLQNLLENAAKYMGDQPNAAITIGARAEGEETACFVRDNGIGIQPRYHEKIFGLFDQLDQSVDGVGIGLSLVKRIIEVHGGRVWVESEGSGKGATFLFILPAR